MATIKLTRSQIKVLSLTAKREKMSIAEICGELNALSSHVSRILASLGNKEFIIIEKVGLSKIVSLSNVKHATLFRSLVLEFGHMEFDAMLSGASLEVLSTLCALKLKSRKEIHENSLVSEASAAKVLRKLRSAGIVQKSDSVYHISARFKTLKDFVAEFRHYLNQRIAQGFASDALILWECNIEFIIESKKSKQENGFFLTSISLFGWFGIQFIVPSSYYFYSPFTKKLRLENAILHSLFMPRTRRNILAVLLVWKKNEGKMNLGYLEKVAEKYGVKSEVSDIVNYFATEGRHRAEGFPPWKEFEIKAEEYGLL